jgi:4-hydroxybenzoate polyprenyltransferase
MSTFRAYLDLCRISNLPTVWTNVLAAGLLATGEAAPALLPAYLLLLAVALSCFYLAGMSLNDLCDLEYDRRHRPDRPLPAGRVSVTSARRLTVALFVIGLALLALAPDASGVPAGMVLILAIVAYDLRHKDNPFSVLLMAACRGLIFVVVALALTGHVAPLVWVAGGIQFMWILLISLVARHENRRSAPYPFPVIPSMLAGISVVDGIVMAVLVSPSWVAAGLAGAFLTRAGQRRIRGD